MESENGEINYENLPTIHSFRSPILQIFQNLISNAFKYSKEKSSTNPFWLEILFKVSS